MPENAFASELENMRERLQELEQINDRLVTIVAARLVTTATFAARIAGVLARHDPQFIRTEVQKVIKSMQPSSPANLSDEQSRLSSAQGAQIGQIQQWFEAECSGTVPEENG